ncbi:hypothetical protein [Micromonospora sp. SH-82]|uniref:hypothetical protein n=1 Tax=Micromonospora sp. SH-82 TaxID=3132938 RepID=UPI003EB8A57F
MPDDRNPSREKKPWEMTANGLRDRANMRAFSRDFDTVVAAREELAGQGVDSPVVNHVQTTMTGAWLAAYRDAATSAASSSSPQTDTSYAAGMTSPWAGGTVTSTAQQNARPNPSAPTTPASTTTPGPHQNSSGHKP